MRGSRDVSLCSLVMRASALTRARHGSRGGARDRRRRGSPSARAGSRRARGRRARRRRPRAASCRSGRPGRPRARCRAVSAPSATSTLVRAEHARGAGRVHPDLPGRVLDEPRQRLAAAAAIPARQRDDGVGRRMPLAGPLPKARRPAPPARATAPRLAGHSSPSRSIAWSRTCGSASFTAARIGAQEVAWSRRPQARTASSRTWALPSLSARCSSRSRSATAPSAPAARAASRRTSTSRSPSARSMIEGVASLAVTSAAIARRRIQAERGIGLRALRGRRPAEPIPGARLQRRHLAADAGQRFEATDRAGNGRGLRFGKRLGRRQLFDEHALGARHLFRRWCTAAARERPPARPRLPTARRCASCSGPLDQQRLHLCHGLGRARELSQRPGRLGPDADAVAQGRRHPADQLGLLQPSERTNAGAPLRVRPPSPRESGRHCACPRR